ncbi:MAG: efflux RND transporter periplasmic adaptor subunit [Pseudoxanthomonas suwonensis]|nr:efflux RND transporter periplasmic adaptor subunit [Pseudoxanthomonas suwonensis]
MTTTLVQMRPFTETVRAVGTVQARESITVTSKVSEVVEQVHFESGQEVARGAPLVTLSGQQQRAALAEAQAQAQEAQRMLARNQQLADQQLIARSQLDTQRATRDSANARVAQIRAQLADRVVRAPFSGVLGIRQVSPGALVTPGTPIATLDDIARVYVDFPLPEMHLSSLEQGMRLQGATSAWPERRFEGSVSTVESRVDAATRAVTVRADFANAERLLRPGMLVNVELFQTERSALLVPEIAVVQVGRETFVWKVGAEDTVEQTIVGVGTRVDGMAEITEGLEAGDRIVLDGTGKLRPGMRIAETAPPATGAEAVEPAADDGGH